jgi:hypothetical protein
MNPKTISVDNLAEATAQEVFDFIAAHLLRQDRKAGVTIEGGFSCRYKDASGAKCAAGSLIPDDKYVPQMEERPWFGTYCKKAGVTQAFEFSENHAGLINSLQALHDNDNVGTWKANLSYLAKRYELSDEILTQF